MQFQSCQAGWAPKFIPLSATFLGLGVSGAHTSPSVVLIFSICQQSWPRCYELSHAVNVACLVSHKPIATPRQPSSPLIFWRVCRCLTRVAPGWVDSAQARTQHLADSQLIPFPSHPWHLKHGLVHRRGHSLHYFLLHHFSRWNICYPSHPPCFLLSYLLSHQYIGVAEAGHFNHAFIYSCKLFILALCVFICMIRH